MWPFTECSIDWGDTASMIGAIAAIIATIYGVRAYYEWKYRATYGDRNKLANDILAAYETGRRTLKFVRFTMFSSDEVIPIMESLSKFEAEKDDERIKRNLLFRRVIRNRINANRDIWKEIEKLIPKAKASFDDNVKNRLENILLTVDDSDSLAHAENVRLLEFHLTDDSTRHFSFEEELDELKKNDGIYQRVCAGYDELKDALDKHL